MADCTCKVKAPHHEWLHAGQFGQAIKVDEWHDDTVFDPVCPFHGEGGSMVAVFPVAGEASVPAPEEEKHNG